MLITSSSTQALNSGFKSAGRLGTSAQMKHDGAAISHFQSSSATSSGKA